MERVLVTGGTGFTGARLVHDLVADGNQVRVLARSAARARDTLPSGVEVVEGDVSDRDDAARAVRGRDVIYHLAAAHREAGITDQRYREVHVDGTAHLLEAARGEGIRRFVHCSTIGVLGNISRPPADESWPHKPEGVYEATKSEAETLALRYHREHGVPVAVARPVAIYGPGDLRLLKLFRMIAKGRFFMLGSGEVHYQLVHVDDLVSGFRRLASHPDAVGEVFILGHAEYPTLNRLAALVAEVLEAPRPRLRFPAWPFLAAGAVCEKICIPLKIEPPIYRRRVEFFTKSRAFSVEKARRVLGWEATTQLEPGLRSTAAWYRENGYLPAAQGATA